MTFVIDPPPKAALAVQGQTDRFPVRRVYCVGRNYAEHAREMGNDPDKEPPFFFSKPADAVVNTPAAISYPPQTENLHYEVELVVALGHGGADLAPEAVMACIWGASVGIDLTRRDLQAQAKAAGRPWDMAKGFDLSAPIAPLRPMAQVPSLTQARIWLAVNDEIRQDADIADMIWPVADHVAYLSRAVTLCPGDVIMTGTPAGVGAVSPGDRITAGVDGIADLSVEIVAS